MPLGRPDVDAPSSPSRRTVRSRVTNGGAYVEKVDGRSAVARRIRDLRDELLAAALHRYNQPSRYGEDPLASPALGLGDLTTEAASLIKHTALLQYEAEALEARVAGGQEVDHNQLVRVINSAQRSLKKLRVLISYRTVLRPDVDERMKSSHTARERRFVILAEAALAKRKPPRGRAPKLAEAPPAPPPFPWADPEGQDALRRGHLPLGPRLGPPPWSLPPSTTTEGEDL